MKATICLRRRSASKRACALKTAKCNSEGIEPPLETLGGSGVCVACVTKWQCGGVKTALVCRFSRNSVTGARARPPTSTISTQLWIQRFEYVENPSGSEFY